MGRIQEALDDFNRAIELEPKNCMFYHSKGLAYNELKDY